MSIDDFRSLSKFLLGVPLPEYGIGDLPQDLVAFYFDILDGKDAGFTKLIAAWIPLEGLPASEQVARFEREIQGDPYLWRQAQNLIMLWYTGVWDPGSADPALQYPDPSRSYPFALVWVLSQSHPRSVPQGFGSWEHAPSKAQS
jgi:hypothetical protein